MPQTAIFGPFFATMTLTLVVWIYMYVRRISFIRASGLTPGQLRDAGCARAGVSRGGVESIGQPEEPVRDPGDLLRARARASSSRATVDATYVTAAWIFAGFRALHSAVHCTVNS